jgi:hypothetical protein
MGRRDVWGENVETHVPASVTKEELYQLLRRFGIPMTDASLYFDVRTGTAVLSLRWKDQDYEYRSSKQKSLMGNARAIKLLIEAKMRAHKRGLEDFGVSMSPYLRLTGSSPADDSRPSIEEVTPEERRAFAILGLDPMVTNGEIDSARKKLVKIYHPDRAPDDETRQVMEGKMAEINNAFEILKRKRNF